VAVSSLNRKQQEEQEFDWARLIPGGEPVETLRKKNSRSAHSNHLTLVAEHKERNVLIVGAGVMGRRIALFAHQNPNCPLKVCGFLDDEGPLGNGVIGRVRDLGRVARKEFVDELILAAPTNAILARHIVDEARRLHLDVRIVPDLFGCHPVRQKIERMGDFPLICLHEERGPELGLFFKRLIDFAVASVALLLLLPLLCIIAALIRLDSEGSVLYCAPRAGRKGKLFQCCKFRTMVRNADALKAKLRASNERAGPFFKISRDPRITRVGQVLRRYSLDELPQLWNVVRGEMSLVGPRPHPVDDVAGYEIEHLARLDVTPGLTGLWQVTARGDPSFHRGMALDREYIRSWSLGLDLRILLRTVRAVMQGSGQ
jgi:exopolysaccharide biosynthesis polyprenyl glycosylphosphotransferase